MKIPLMMKWYCSFYSYGDRFEMHISSSSLTTLSLKVFEAYIPPGGEDKVADSEEGGVTDQVSWMNQHVPQEQFFVLIYLAL